MVGVWEPRAGFLVPEAAIEAHLALAARHGAELRTGEAVTAWRATDPGVEVTTPRGTYSAGRLVLAAGAWMRALAGELPGELPGAPAGDGRLPLTVERTVIHWFRPARPTALYSPERFPIFIGEYAPGLVWYGIPDAGDGVKAALHHHGEPADPDALRRDVAPEEVAYVRALLRAFMPAADGPLAASAVCMYTNTPDGHFIVDRHPAHPQVVLASPCSGHGFKFASALGEVLADLALDAAPSFDLRPFRLARFR
jgi:sarcosine oxidase